MTNYIQYFKEPWATIGNETQYKLINTEKELIILFQGSQSLQDWKYNFMFRKKPYKNMPIPYSVHRGFLAAWKNVNDYFLSLVKHVEKPITVVGHSHGGALATLCAEDIWFNYPEKRDNLKLITYGTPRILGRRNYHKIRERWANAENYSVSSDLVSHIPFYLMGYTHTKRRIRVKNESFFKRFKIISNHMLPVYEKLLYKK